VSDQQIKETKYSNLKWGQLSEAWRGKLVLVEISGPVEVGWKKGGKKTPAGKRGEKCVENGFEKLSVTQQKKQARHDQNCLRTARKQASEQANGFVWAAKNMV